jgi:hypothetical protein
MIADVQNHILGADFHRHFRLLVDMKPQHLTDGRPGYPLLPNPSIRPKHTGDPYLKLLSEFPALTQVCSSDSPSYQAQCHSSH